MDSKKIVKGLIIAGVGLVALKLISDRLPSIKIGNSDINWDEKKGFVNFGGKIIPLNIDSVLKSYAGKTFSKKYFISVTPNSRKTFLTIYNSKTGSKEDVVVIDWSGRIIYKGDMAS